jgi:hypothetical protein
VLVLIQYQIEVEIVDGVSANATTHHSLDAGDGTIANGGLFALDLITLTLCLILHCLQHRGLFEGGLIGKLLLCTQYD